MINLIISKSSNNNSQYIYKEIEENLLNGEKSFLIVPEQYTLQSDINLLENIDFATIMDAKVLSFSSFCRYIIDRSGGFDGEILGKNGKLMVITNILKDINDELILFKNAYQNIDFVNDLKDLITNIKDNNFDEEFFKKIDNDLEDEVLKLKFRESKLIFDAYQKAIKDHFIDAEDMVELVVDKLDSCDFLKDANFYFDKFDYVSDIKMDFIEKLVKISKKVSICLTLDKNFIENPLSKDIEIYDMAIKFYHRLKEIDQVHEINLQAEINKQEDIKHLCTNFEKYNPQIYDKPPKNIYLLESTSTKSEVENVALTINKLIVKEKIRYKDVAIYISDQNEYENEIKKIFTRYNIPIFLNKTNKLINNHIIKTFLSCLRIVIYGYNYQDLSYFLRSNIFDFGENANKKAITLQNYLLTRKIKGSMFLADKYFIMDYEFYQKFYENDPQKEEKISAIEEEYGFVNDIRSQVIDLFSKLIDLSKKETENKEIVTAIYELISNEKFISGITNYQNILKEKSDLDKFEENSQVWDKFLGILEEIASLMGSRNNSLKDIYTLIYALCNDIEIGIIPPSKDHLTITSFQSPRIPNKKINFALGLNDSFFPSKSAREFILAKDEKEKLKNIDLDLKIYEEDLEEKEKLNLYKMFGGSDKIYLSYALSDKNGGGINKSIVLNGILNIFPKLKAFNFTNISLEDLKYSKNLSTKFAMDNLRKIKLGENLDKKSLEFTKAFNNYLKNYGLYEIILAALFYSNDKNNLSLATATNLYPKNHFNITEIETYSKCPYRYFINYGLKIERDQSFDVDNMELGTIVHSCYEEISKLIKDKNLEDITNEDLENLIADNFSKSIENNLDKARRDDKRNIFILNNIIKNTKNNSKEVLGQLKSGEFRISDVEVDFGYGKENDLPKVFVDDKNYLRGRIDRIDRAGNFLRIIDYKTGKKTFKIVNVLNGLDLQLLVYMISAKENDKEITPIGSFYMPLADELVKLNEVYEKNNLSEIYADKFRINGLIVKVNEEIFKLIDKGFTDIKTMNVIDQKNTDILSLEEEEILENFAKKLVSSYIKEIKLGNIKINPLRYNDSRNECQYCDYKGICKFDESIDFDKYRDFDSKKTIKDLENEEI